MPITSHKKRLFLLHGFLGEGSDFNPLADPLRKSNQDIEILAPSLFSKNEDEFSKVITSGCLKEAGRTLNNKIREVSLTEDENFLLGYSLGGRVALHAVIDDPGLWTKVFLVSTHPGLQSESERSERRANDQIWSERFRNEAWEEVISAWQDQPVFVGTKATRRESASFDRIALSHALEAFSLGRQSLSHAEINRVSQKALWVVGERDEKFLKVISNMKERIPDTRLQVIKEAGHRVHWDQPEFLSEVVRQFL